MTRLMSAFAFVGCLWSLGLGPVQLSSQAKPVGEQTVVETTLTADTLLLDRYTNAYAAFSLRRLRSDYSGPVVRVRRSSDDAEQDFGFGADDKLDASAVESWLSGADGYVVRWYGQISGQSPLAQSDPTRQPFIAKGGTVTTDSDGRIAIKFDRSRNTYLTVDDKTTVQGGSVDDGLFYFVAETGVTDEKGAKPGVLSLNRPGLSSITYSLRFRGGRDSGNGRWRGPTLPFEGAFLSDLTQPGWTALNNHSGTTEAWSNNTKFYDKYLQDSDQGYMGTVTVGVQTINNGEGFDGYMTEVVALPGRATDSGVQAVFDNVNAGWNLAPQGDHPDALLPQRSQWQIDLYDWLETIEESDVTLPQGTLTYDNSYDTEDELADLWLRVEGLTASSVTRREPGWYVLDNGNGKGIEATGVVRANHNPKGGSYGGNPPRSWQNEPALWYDLDLPLSEGGQGNPWYQDPAMATRAMVVSAVDLTMHSKFDGSNAWYDMVGKSFLGMAEAYRMAGDVMPSDARDAYETGMSEIVSHLTARGPRAVNTNMDMFAIKGAVELYRASSDSALQQECVEMVKAALLGHTDGELGTKHDLFATGNRKGGVFHPAGFIMEGDQPDLFYGGESMLHIVGAVETIRDRDTGDVPSDWTFLEEVSRRLQEWRTYQHFYDPYQYGKDVGGTVEKTTLVTAGSGFNSRTSGPVPRQQASEPWKHSAIAAAHDNDAFKGSLVLKEPWEMRNDISNKLSEMDNRMDVTYTKGQPEEWAGWSPWTKKIPYLPPKGWYSDLKAMRDANDPLFEEPPHARTGETFNKTFGGHPNGEAYWSYIDTDPNGMRWGFFVEAQAYQGGHYGGWYGGKVETFWTEETGVVLLNRHGKTGCDRSGPDDYSSGEDSVCWWNLEWKAAHHVWGRDENGKGFTTLFVRGYEDEIDRPKTFDTGASSPSVSITNKMNENNRAQEGDVLDGTVEIKNKFWARSDGLEVVHTITTDQTDDMSELWASLPVYLRQENPHNPGDEHQGLYDDTRIEHRDGGAWVELPFDTDGDSIPEQVTTDALRLGRNWENGDGPQYVHVSFNSPRIVRRAQHKYYDPYQTQTGVQTVLIDLHGNPGTTKTMPARKSATYTLQVIDPTSGGKGNSKN